jgi:shikimate kinase
MSTIQTFMASVAHAIRNQETVSLGGGLFTPSEMREVMQQHKDMVTALQVAASMIADMSNGYMTRDLCESPEAFDARLNAIGIERG